MTRMAGPPCEVYVIEAIQSLHHNPDGHALLKIGITGKLDSRLRTISTSCPFPIELLVSRRMPSREIASGIERRLHEALRKYRTAGEWFWMSCRGATGDLDYAIAEYWVEEMQQDEESAFIFLMSTGIDALRAGLVVQALYGIECCAG